MSGTVTKRERTSRRMGTRCRRERSATGAPSAPCLRGRAVGLWGTRPKRSVVAQLNASERTRPSCRPMNAKMKPDLQHRGGDEHGPASARSAGRSVARHLIVAASRRYGSRRKGSTYAPARNGAGGSRRNHARERQIWLVYHAKASGRSSLAYNDAVDEAICFGWIDSTVKKLGPHSRVQRFTPRRKARHLRDEQGACAPIGAGRAQTPAGRAALVRHCARAARCSARRVPKI